MVVSKVAANAAKALFMEIVIEGTTPSTAPTIPNLNTWINGLKVPFTSALDADPASFSIKKTYGIKETTFIVDRTTMKILAKGKTPEEGLTLLDGLP